MVKNRIAELLDVAFPIIEGGMAFIGDGKLAAAVSNAGGFGQVAASGHGVQGFERQIEIAASLTKKPFGVNVPISRMTIEHSYFEVIRKHKDKIKAVSLGAGDPRPFIAPLKSWGLRVMVVGGTVRHAINAEKYGADLFICEGFEAGGRNSPNELTLFSLIPQVAEAVEIPVAAAGGISNAKGVLAAIALGAEGVQIGTRFIASHESPAHVRYKQKLVEAKDIDTVVLERSIGGINRVIRTKLPEEVLELEKKQPLFEELYPYINGLRNRAAAIEGNLEDGWIHSGQSAGLIRSVASVEEIVAEIIDELKGHEQNVSAFVKGWTTKS
jgi:enoyl-[acyl-carrier protein] reductase II